MPKDKTAKQIFRQAALLRRTAILDRDQKSQQMQNSLSAWLADQSLKTICCYVDKDPEARTRDLLKQWCRQQTFEVAVPYCDGDDLTLFRLTDFQQLRPARFGLLEPAVELRVPKSIVAPDQIDCFIVPGVAFDSSGNRMGYGRGFYDRLLSNMRSDAIKLGYCFAEQVVSKMDCLEPWDIPMDFVLTENAIHRFV